LKIQKLFAIRDKNSEMFGQPMMHPNASVALRSFQDACNEKTSVLARHPKDFDLYCIGEYDVETGLLAAVDHTVIASATEFVNT
jgi:hypothetical protein